jgi:putative membrane protein
MIRGLSAIVSALHLLALAIGLPAIVLRAVSLGGPLDASAVRRALVADTAWGIAAFLWLTTGPARAFGPLEKGSTYYLQSPLFYVKLGLFLFVFLIESRPMVALIRWRMALRSGGVPDLSRAGLYARMSWVEAALVITIVFVAAFMARGFGMGG